IPAPPWWGFRVTEPEEIDLREVWRCLDLTELFRVGWGAKGLRGDEYDKLVANEFKPKLAELQELILHESQFAPRIITGFYPAQSHGDDLVIHDPDDHGRELRRFTFPRQGREPWLCLSDYVSPAESGRMDNVCLQVVTVGSRPTQLCDEWNKAGEYAKALYYHGLATETAEALAEWNHRRVKAAWGVGPKQGNRYSFGYSACPDLADQEKLFDVLPAEQELGLELTDHHQIIPEQSTSAVIFHHPECTYFVV
ncbi:methionine synthase, partial [Candidatus Poribacteria bacterium]|nr:methionine synthase [Candidatus Poribacteria bacterium]